MKRIGQKQLSLLLCLVLLFTMAILMNTYQFPH